MSTTQAFPRHSIPNYLSILIRIILVTGLSGCSKLLELPIQKQPSEATLQFQVTSANKPGAYTITGNTNLPDKGQIKIAAIRYLHPTSQASRDLNPKPTYAILAYQVAEVNQGKWQTNLDLWKIASTGSYQESWQLDQSKLKISLQPDSEVVFLATYTIDSQANNILKLDQQPREKGKTLENGILLTLVDNQRYVQSTQKLAIALPTGKTIPPPVLPEDINGGWGDRYLMPDEPPNSIKLQFPTDRKTNSLPLPEEFMK